MRIGKILGSTPLGLPKTEKEEEGPHQRRRRRRRREEIFDGDLDRGNETERELVACALTSKNDCLT